MRCVPPLLFMFLFIDIEFIGGKTQTQSFQLHPLPADIPSVAQLVHQLSLPFIAYPLQLFRHGHSSRYLFSSPRLLLLNNNTQHLPRNNARDVYLCESRVDATRAHCGERSDRSDSHRHPLRPCVTDSPSYLASCAEPVILFVQDQEQMRGVQTQFHCKYKTIQTYAVWCCSSCPTLSLQPHLWLKRQWQQQQDEGLIKYLYFFLVSPKCTPTKRYR